MNTDELKKLADLLVEHYAKIQDGATAEQRDLRLVGSLGLFTDGNEKNS
jgi:hypothetical protein